MRRRLKMMAYAMAGTVGAGMLSAAAVQAHGVGFGGASPDEVATRQEAMFQREASTFGFTVDELKEAWADGKTPIELAKEKGLTEEQIQKKLREARVAEMKSNLDIMVEKGILTRSQADRRLNVIKNQTPGKKGHRGTRGHGMGRGM